MAINFLNSVDLNKNQLIKAAIESQPNDAAVGTGVEGQLYFNTTQQTIKVYREILPATTPKTYEWGSISGDIEEVQESLVNGLLGINVLNPTGPIPVVGLDIEGLTPLGTGVALTDSLAVYDLSTTTNKSITVDDIVGKSTWLIEGDGANPQTIVNGDTVDIVGSTYISSVASAIGANDFAVTLTHDATTRNDTTSTVSANVFPVVDSVTTNTTGHVTAINVKTVTVPDNNTTYTLPTTNGNNPDIVLTGSNPSSTDIVNMNGVSTTVKVTGSGTDTLEFDLVDDVTITTSLTISGTAVDALDVVGKGQSAATIGTDVAATLTTKGYVDGLVEGGLTFIGTFRADTGEILSGGNIGLYLYNVPGGAGTRVAVAVGDYYVIATSGGDFYANTAYPLDIGDSIIGVVAANADASVVTDWSLVSQGVVVNSFTNINGTYVSASNVNTNATGAVTVGTLDLSAIDGTSDTTTRFLSKDNTWDVPSYTTNTDAKYALTAEPKSGTSVPLTLTGSDGGSTTIVDLTEGANITLTRTSATEITIASTDTGALGKNILLDTGDAWVSSSAAGGITTFAVDVSNANVFNGTVGAVNVKCEVIDARTTPAGVAGQTVYADITRGVDAGGATFGLQSLNISFTGTPASSAYRVLLTYIG